MKTRPVPVFDFVVFGATGDLTQRKLLPALYLRFRDGQVPEGSRVVGAARSKLSDEEFRARADEALRKFAPEGTVDEAGLAGFKALLHFVSMDGSQPEGWEPLATLLNEQPADGEQGRVRVFYLATSPDLYGAVCRNIGAAGLNTDRTRVVLEKPIGRDLDSARAINDGVGEVFKEEQTFRIDHYLGKETVQNLMALRFANTIFERLWNADVIDHVQITVAETVGVEGRGPYYDRSGALRDMVQNHLLQLLCLLAMESPVSMDAQSVRDEKLKVLRALRPLPPHEVAHATVRGQYVAGAVHGKPVPGYKDDLLQGGGPNDSRTETFVALKAEVHNRRWANVPFYLRTGKRLPQKVSEVVVHFRSLPFTIFPAEAGELESNQLIVRLQPEEGMRLEMMTKEPGPGGLRLRPTGLDISFEKAFGTRYPDSYERLLMDTVRGDATLFMRRDEVEAAWTWVEPVLQAWEGRGDAPKPYASGSWGPTASIALIERDGRTWHESIEHEAVE